MAFIRIPGLAGRFYVPEPQAAASKKHPCPDCQRCQWCADERCRVCRLPPPGSCPGVAAAAAGPDRLTVTRSSAPTNGTGAG